MSHNVFLATIGFQHPIGEDIPGLASELLSEALRIDDRRSEYCERLEARIAEQASEISALRALLQCWKNHSDLTREPIEQSGQSIEIDTIARHS